MSDLERLGQMVKYERQRLYRTVDKARAGVDLSRGAWDNVEHGRPAKELTYLAIEEALRWEAGSCQRVLAGGEPVLLNTPDKRFEAVIEAMELAEETKRFIIESHRATAPRPGRTGSETG